MFTLHPQLAKDCFEIGNLHLCKVLLMNNSLFPWVILVPMHEDKTEIFELDEKDSVILTKEINLISSKVKKFFKADKINIAALGNQVPQLHIHIIARFEDDHAWPNPVWGTGGQGYDELSKKEQINRLKNHLFSI